MSEPAQMHAASPQDRIVLTRSAEDCASWAQNLSERGYESVTLPCIETESIDSPAVRTALVAALDRADWLVVTSQRGVSALAELLGRAAPEHLRIAAVGAATAERARRLLGRADLIARVPTAAGLASELTETLHSTTARIVLALAENAGDSLSDALLQAGHECLRFDIYRTIPIAAGNVRRRLADIGGQTVFLASPSAVLGFVNQVEIDDAARLVSIGPSTTAAIRRAGLSVHAQATTPSLAGMLAAMKE